MKRVHLKGRKFGRWTVLDDGIKTGKQEHFQYLCLCECGTITRVESVSLVRGSSSDRDGFDLWKQKIIANESLEQSNIHT